MKRQIRWILTIAIAFLTAACGSSTPYTMSGASFSSQGVDVDLAKASCYVNRSADMYLEGVTPDRLGLDLKLQIKNGSDQVANLSEARILLLDAAVRATQVLTPEKPEVVSIPPGMTKQVQLRFTTSDDLSCRHGFELVLADSVDLGGTPMALSPIRLAASR
jgi:hypothetical protein